MWSDFLKTGASFRGVPFSTVDAEARIGRRSVTHEFPQRDEPYVEDLGRRARMFVVDAYVIGDDYLVKRDALIEAIEEAGPGELIHPRWGILQVSVDGYVGVKESPGDGRRARFAITFVEAGQNTFQKSERDTVAQLEQAGEDVDDAAELDFGSLFRVDGASVIAEEALRSLQSDLDGLLTTVRSVTDVAGAGELVRLIGLNTSTLSALIRTPVTFAQGVRSVYSSLVLALNRPVAAFSDLEALFGRNTRPSAALVAAATPGSTRARLLGNESARSDLQRRLALSNQARAFAVAIAVTGDREPAIATVTKALTMRDRLLAQIDVELEQNDPPAEVSAALVRLRGAVTADVALRVEQLRRASVFRPPVVLPSLVLAHRIYQDATRADELEARNGVRHPAFVPAAPLEVLQ